MMGTRMGTRMGITFGKDRACCQQWGKRRHTFQLSKSASAVDTFQKITSAGYVDTFQAGYVDTFQAGYVDRLDTSLLTHLRNQSKLYSMNSFLPTYYSQYIVLIEIFHWLGWHLAYSLIKLFHLQSEAQAGCSGAVAVEMLGVRSKPMMQCSPLTCRYVKSFHNNDNF